MERIERWKELVENTLERIFKTLKAPEPLLSAMKYYVFQKGKRIRPLFVIAVSSSLGGNEEDASVVGSAIEIIHNYSLIHDDLPALDNDDFRRGLPSCHKKFGEAVAILAGDGLLTFAFEVLSEKRFFKTLSSEDLIRIINIISRKAGAEGMVGGQVLDINRFEDIEKINLMKTSALFSACFMCGAVVSKKYELLDEMEELGRKVGILFQLTDDFLDKDGYFLKFGEEKTRSRIEETYKEINEKLKEIFKGKDEEIRFLIDKIYRRI